MTTPSPGIRLRTKTSDISDFFKTGKTRSADADEPGSSSPTFLSEPESPVRKRSSRIPFLGRQRKKSTHSDASTSSPSPTSRQSEAEARNSSASKLVDVIPDVPFVSDAERSQQSSPSKLPSTSLSSKLAHFVPSRQKLLSISPRPRTKSTTEQSPSHTLSPPTPPSREPSIDSTVSESTRSLTPRPNQPTITVSVPPDSLEDYKDLFTLPKVEDGQRTPTNESVRFPRPSTSSDSSVPHIPTMKRRIARSTTTSRISRKHVNTTLDSEDSEAVMSDAPKSSVSMLTPTAEKRRTLATTMPYKYSEKSSPRSIMKTPPDRPPAFPLPPPPSNPPSSALPLIPLPALALKNDSPPRRQRAQTLSTMSSANSVSSQSSVESKKLPDVPSEKENFDSETASPDQLRQELKLRTHQLEETQKALSLRQQQYDELASYLLTITDSHVAEKRSLQKKIDGLEMDATRRDKELQGLKWLLTNNRDPATHFASEDSGTESHQTTSDSYRDSGTSGAESSSTTGRKVKRNHIPMSTLQRSSTTSDTAIPHLSPRSSTSSMGTTNSPSSSTSSLSLNAAITGTPATTVASLGAIPETTLPLSRIELPPPPVSVRVQDPVVAAAILAAETRRTQEERRKSTSNRISVSSVSSASAAYTANLKRGRPPSIAQVLASSPRMENGVATPGLKSRAYISGSMSS